MPDYYVIPTNIGEAKMANALSLGIPIAVTELALGDGEGDGTRGTPVPNPEANELVSERRRAPLNSFSVDPDNGNVLIAEQVIPETAGGWWIREMGLFDEDGDMIFVCNTPPTYKPQLSEGSGRTQVVRMATIVSNTAAVTLKVDPSVVLATRNYVQEVITVHEEDFEEKIDQRLAYFASVEDIEALAFPVGTSVYLTQEGRSGEFAFDGSDLSAEVAADPEQAIFIAPGSDYSGESGAWVRRGYKNVDIRWAGAVADWDGNTGTPNENAIQAANDLAEFLGVPLSGEGEFAIDGTVYITTDCIMDYCKLYELSALALAVQVGPDKTSEPSGILRDKKIGVPSVFSSGNGGNWEGLGTGVATVNLVNCQVRIDNIRDYAVGLSQRAFNEAHAYNNYYINGLIGNQVNHELVTDLGGTGYVNENNYWGGRYALSSSYGVDVAGSRHIRIKSNNNNVPNNNRWNGSSLEGDGPELTIECQGRDNMWLACRWEGSNGVLFDGSPGGGSGSNNIIFHGDNARSLFDKITESNGASRNTIQTIRRSVFSVSDADAGVRYRNSFSATAPAIAFYGPEANPYNEPESWQVAIASRFIALKNESDNENTMKLEGAKVEFGTGEAPPDAFVGRGAGGEMVTVHWRPDEDNTYDLGKPSERWREIYAANATINTSDAREKDEIRDLSSAERSVAVRLKEAVRAFKWSRSLEDKGDQARTHFGWIAQDVAAAFESEGLDPHGYALFCYDQWDAETDEDGVTVREAGSRYGVRYNELLAFIVSSL